MVGKSARRVHFGRSWGLLFLQGAQLQRPGSWLNLILFVWAVKSLIFLIDYLRLADYLLLIELECPLDLLLANDDLIWFTSFKPGIVMESPDSIELTLLPISNYFLTYPGFLFRSFFSACSITSNRFASVKSWFLSVILFCCYIFRIIQNINICIFVHF